MQSQVVIEADHLVKDYVTRSAWATRSTTRALDGLNLDVRDGEVFGFLGPNGAGKTTTIRLMMDLLRPTDGVVRVFGQTPREGGPSLRHRIGYLPGDLLLRGRATARDLLRHFAQIRDGRGHGRIDELASRLHLDLSRPIRTLSKGNRQKIGVIQAFMHRPELLILDEPTSGLDPLLQHEFLAMVREARSMGTTVFMSSHVLSEVELIADRVAVVRSGVIVDVDDVATLRQRAGQQVEFTFAEPVDAHEFSGLDEVTDVVAEGTSLRCLLHGEPDPLLRVAMRHRVVHWSARDRELEDLFLDFYRVPAEELADTHGDSDGR